MDPVERPDALNPTVLGAAWRFKWLVALVTLVVAGLSLAYAYQTRTEHYVADASLVVEDPRATSVFGVERAEALDPERYVTDQAAILESTAVALRAAEIGDEADPPLEYDADDIIGGTSVRFDEASDVIEVFFTAPDEYSAELAANSLIQAYSDVRRQEAQRNAASAVAVLDESTAEIEGELDEIDARILAVRQDPVRQELEQQFRDGIARLVARQPLLESLRDSSDNTDVRRELADIQNVFNRYTTIFAIADDVDGPGLDPDPETQAALDKQVLDAMTRLAGLTPQLADTADEDALSDLRQELGDIQEQMQTLQIIVNIEEEGPELVGLFREQSTAIGRLADLEAQRDRILVDTELLSGGVVLASPAEGASFEQSDIRQTVVPGVAAGLLAGVALAYALALRRRRFTARHEPELVLGVPLLAEVPEFKEDRVRTRLPVRDAPRSASAEAFRFVAAGLDLQLGTHQRRPIEAAPADAHEDEVRLFFVTSALLLEGKTVLTANAALAAAREGTRVLAIDADFGNQVLTQTLRDGDGAGDATVPKVGITEVVEAGLALEEAVQTPVAALPTLHLLSRGTRRTTAPDFFSLPATQAFFEQVPDRYDMVIVDGPPLLQIAYASTLARYAHRVIIIVPHQSRVRNLEDVAQRLELIGTPVAGYVYNRAPLRREMKASEGSLKDVLGAGPDDSDPGTDDRRPAGVHHTPNA